MTDTPRTEALRKHIGSMIDMDAISEAIDAHETLERELAASKAENEKLQAEVAEMREALQKCRNQFVSYWAQHLDKGTPAALDKAAVNQRFQLMCEAALASDPPPVVPRAIADEMAEALHRADNDIKLVTQHNMGTSGLMSTLDQVRQAIAHYSITQPK